jgi:GNAT superfamily N-acetyltransferase
VEAVRRATAADVPRLEELAALAAAELAAQERGGRVFVNREARVGDLAEVVADPAAVAVAGLFHDVVVGLGTGRTERLRDGSVLGIIEDLYVEPEARGVGVGEAMMGELLDWFRGQGCTGVDAYALPGMRETKNFFETSGFTARLLVVHHRMAADGEA